MSARPPLLLVEDNPMNQKVLVRFLSAHGFHVAVAGSATEADDWLQGNVPGLVLMDVSLPGEDGLSYVRRLRDSGFDAPIIAVTAHAMSGDMERALEAGCTGYLSKPVELSAMLQTVQAHLRREVA